MLLNLFLKYSFVCSSDLIMLEQEIILEQEKQKIILEQEKQKTLIIQKEQEIILEQEKQKTLKIQKSLVTLKAGEFYWLS